jgi:hypothetical protein
MTSDKLQEEASFPLTIGCDLSEDIRTKLQAVPALKHQTHTDIFTKLLKQCKFYYACLPYIVSSGVYVEK